LDSDTVSKYVAAVGDLSHPAFEDSGPALAPPMAVAALSLRGVVEDLQIPGGTLHVGQDLEFHGAVQVGETLDCKAILAQNAVRRGMRFIVVELDVADGAGRRVLTGKSTILIPVG
jgi:acyl dehydratase